MNDSYGRRIGHDGGKEKSLTRRVVECTCHVPTYLLVEIANIRVPKLNVDVRNDSSVKLEWLLASPHTDSKFLAFERDEARHYANIGLICLLQCCGYDHGASQVPKTPRAPFVTGFSRS